MVSSRQDNFCRTTSVCSRDGKGSGQSSARITEEIGLEGTSLWIEIFCIRLDCSKHHPTWM